WWCVILGANLGGNITPIGSASTVVAATIIHRQQLKLGFMDFVKLALPFAAMQIVLAIVYVLIATAVMSAGNAEPSSATTVSLQQ
ncbi:MAG: hypothetical protein O3B86_18010, partial [Planctomycetota bacterium]|nr:hypothetical protein [Planctomycetota bacterium]